jgi:hypothetical protein
LLLAVAHAPSLPNGLLGLWSLNSDSGRCSRQRAG